MLKRWSIIMAWIGLLLITEGAQGQLRFMDVTGSGARAEGMGGAFIGLADDATALSWNPAGLTQLERPEASLVFRQSFDSYKFTSPSEDLSSSSNHSVFNFGSFAYPMKIGGKKLTFALAYQNQVDLFLFTEGDDFEEKQTGGINTLSPGVAYQVLPMLSLGVSANLWTGSSKYKYDPDGGTDSWKDTWSGFNYQVGVLADMEQSGGKIPLKIGLSFRSPFEMKDKWHFLLTDGSYKWTWEFPMMFGFGASYRIGDNLTVAADYEIRKFGKSKYGNKDYDFWENLSRSKKDLNPIRVGAEYLVVTDNLVIPVRAGFKTVPTLFADFDVNGDVDKQVTGTAISAGSGIIFKKFAFDIALTRRAFDIKDNYNETKREFSYFILSGSAIIYF